MLPIGHNLLVVALHPVFESCLCLFDILENFGIEEGFEILDAVSRQVINGTDLVHLHANVRRRLMLQLTRVHAIFPIEILNNNPRSVAHAHVIVDLAILHRLDKLALQIADLGRIHCSIDETFATTHGVEEELLRREASNKRVLHKATAIWAIIVFCVVRQRAVVKAIRNTAAIDVLLSDTTNHLGNVDRVTL